MSFLFYTRGTTLETIKSYLTIELLKRMQFLELSPSLHIAWKRKSFWRSCECTRLPAVFFSTGQSKGG